MMKKLVFISILFFLNGELKSAPDISKMGNEAKAFLQAQDYEKASHLYAQVLTFDLPPWQRALALYNLGTVKLAQKHNKEALHLFSQIPVQSVSNPLLFRSLYLNKGIAYFNQSQELSVSDHPYGLEEQLDFYQESLRQFEEVKRIDCLLQEFEMAFPPTCQTSIDIEAYIKKVRIGIQQNKMQQRAILIKAEQEAQQNPLTLLLGNYRLILLQESFIPSSLQNLLSAQKQIPGDSKILNNANLYLETSLEYLTNNQIVLARFFLLAAFDVIKKLDINSTDDPKEALTNLLMQAWYAKKMTELSLKIDDKNRPLAESIVKNVQKEVVQLAQAFPLLVLAFEQKNFKNPDSQIEHCQQQPWNLVFPLFDKGYQSAVAAQPPYMLAEQDQSLTNWKEALHILSQNPSSSNTTSASNSSIQDILKVIQEMQAQDKFPSEPTYQELHSW